MTQILSLPTTYDSKYLNTTRVFPLIDLHLQSLIFEVNQQGMPNLDHNFLDTSMTVMNMYEDLTRDLFDEFKVSFRHALESNLYNHIHSLSHRADIIQGCTQYIDSLYIRFGAGGVQVLENEYTYHSRLNPNIFYKTVEKLEPRVPLIISQPFYYGKTHARMDEILDRCLDLEIPVHIDGAWITACKNISVDFTHPAIQSFASSMSKGYGLSGWNRIGVRWTKEDVVDSITIMNDFVQVPAENVAVGLYFLKHVDPGHLWTRHGDNYGQICHDFNLTPTNSIHLAMRGQHPVGVEALLRYLE